MAISGPRNIISHTCGEMSMALSLFFLVRHLNETEPAGVPRQLVLDDGSMASLRSASNLLYSPIHFPASPVKNPWPL